MPQEKTRVDFHAPTSLVERADSVADILDVSRTRLLIEALEDELSELTTDEEFRRQLREAFYSNRIDFETVDIVLGREEAMQMKLLRGSLNRSPPEPALAGDLPTDEAFYDGEPSAWAPEESATTDDGRPDADG